MTAINEIMYRNCVPADFENYLLQLFRNTFHLLQTVVSEPPQHQQQQQQSATTVTNNGSKLATMDEV
jgi:hypothetical protein